MSTRKTPTGPRPAASPAASVSTASTGAPDGAPVPARPRLTRRRLVGSAGAAGAVGLLAGGAGGASAAGVLRDDPAALGSVGGTQVPFHGLHQAGITTPAQAYGHLVAFDLAQTAGRKGAAALLRRWSAAAEAMTAGRAPSHDDQIALDAGPCSLTITFGFGRSFFFRTGMVKHIPEALAPLPAFSSDRLDPARSNGDLWVQIGADDGLVAFHALRILQKEAGGTARLRWQMNGFNRTKGATERPMTVRNLMGQVDGTNNPKPAQKDFDQRIFVPRGGAGSRSPEWMGGGSYVVVRRIRMLLDDWDNLPLHRQEEVIGRRKSNGSPLSSGADGTETTRVDLGKRNPDGTLAIAADAHIRVAAPASNSGASMLRRGFSFHDGYEADGSPDSGLLFVAWQSDPLVGFVPVQRKLDSADGLSRFIRHEASGLFAVPGGAGEGEYVGQRLLEA
jgi:dye decolorizing peroxidase